jgi:hypothetical protein
VRFTLAAEIQSSGFKAIKLNDPKSRHLRNPMVDPNLLTCPFIEFNSEAGLTHE